MLLRSILISWISSRWLLSMLFMVSTAEGWLPFSFIGESSDGEDEVIDQGFGACPNLWIHGSKSTIYSLIPDDYFKEQLRVRKETFEVILNHLNPHLTREDTAMHDCIPPEKVLAIGLYRLNHGNSYVTIGPTFKVGKSTVIEAVQDVLNALFYASDQLSNFLQRRQKQRHL